MIKLFDVPSSKILIFQILLILVLGFLVYSSSLSGDFIWDDYLLVKYNTHIKTISYLPRLFLEDIGAGKNEKSCAYRPLQMASYCLDYQFWRLNIFGYHLANVLLHIFTALALFWLVSILFGDRLLAFWTSILFVVNPLHTEAVAYISGRADLLAGVFVLLGFIFYIKQTKTPNTWVFWLMIASYFLALFSKENSLIFFLVILLYHYR
jgi:hypothetical protein